MFGPDGKNVSKMTWEEFCDFQRWSEFPERKNDPPMTTDFAFWINGKKFFVQAKILAISLQMKTGGGFVFPVVKIRDGLVIFPANSAAVKVCRQICRHTVDEVHFLLILLGFPKDRKIRSPSRAYYSVDRNPIVILIRVNN